MMLKNTRSGDPSRPQKIAWLFMILALSVSLLSCATNKQPLVTDHQNTILEKKEDLPDMGSTGQRLRKTEQTIRPALDRQRLEPFFAGLRPPNWKIHERIRHFTPENLYEIINGAAELYLSYDVVQLSYVSFFKAGDSSSFIDLSIYDVGSRTNAFGVFSVERFPDGLKLNLGNISYRRSNSIFIWKGRYYVIITGSKPSEMMNAVGLKIAEKVAAFLEDEGKPVWGLTGFPGKKLLPDTIKFFKVDALGLAFMHNTYTADYQNTDAPFTAFLSLTASENEASNRIDRYADHAAKFGRGAEAIIDGNMKFLVCNMGGSFDIIFQEGRIMGGVTAISDRSQAMKTAVQFRKELRIMWH